jgi:hypothetical protein
LITMPRPLRKTNTFAVPRSIPTCFGKRFSSWFVCCVVGPGRHERGEIGPSAARPWQSQIVPCSLIYPAQGANQAVETRHSRTRCPRTLPPQARCPAGCSRCPRSSSTSISKGR